ncbi:MAG: DNA mismatch repair endonuclease MutL, partial [Clostridia bacterium]|nr:DNA mismatch repair endonuclease MutL [Clostridia bacterium]
MSNINVLPFSIANLIAAGEVVDRPASVVKELLENAIDAGSTRINIEIQNGGVSLIRVSDNGCGMTPEDLGISVLRHATSKIKEEADLSRIMTLGFRGEALAATAAVSQMRIISKTSELPYGAMLTVHGGEILSLEERGAVNGTTVIVERLFYNVPARLKFLKRDATEALAVTSVVEKTALAHPEIAFHYLIDGSTKILTAGDGDRRSVLNHFYGKAFASRLIEVNSGEGPVHIEGYISRPDNVRPNRNYQNFFLNGRYIRSRTIGAALEQAYVSFIAPEKFPCCTLYVDIDPSAVDINVHPAKLEVKFSNEKAVFDTVYYTVRSALEVNRDRPEIDLGRATEPSAFMPTSSEENLARVAENEEQAARNRVTEAFVPVVDRVAGDTPPKQIRMDVGTLPTRSTRHAETETTAPETVRVSVSLPKTGTGASTDPTVPPSKEAPKPSHPAPPAPPVLTRSQSRAVRASFQETLNETPAEPETETIRTEISQTVEPAPEKPADVPPVPEAVPVQAEAVTLPPEEPAAPAEAPVSAE